MDTEKISKRFNGVRVVPGNGHSPHTGSLVFYAFDNELGYPVVVKSSDGIKNNHMTIKEEWDLLWGDARGISGVILPLDYYEEDGVQYMVMDDDGYKGGRRERWREVFGSFSKWMFEYFLWAFISTLHGLHSKNVLHEDIECANMLYSELSMSPVLIDFGRAKRAVYDFEWLLDQLRLDKSTKQNAFFREITNTGGVYVTEPPHFRFDAKPVIENTLDEALKRLHRHG